MHANDTGTEIMTSTRNIHTSLTALDRRGEKRKNKQEVILLLSAKTFSSVESQGNVSLPQKTRSLVHSLPDHSNTAEELQFAANNLEQTEGLTAFKVSFAIFAQESFYCSCSVWDMYCIFLKR